MKIPATAVARRHGIALPDEVERRLLDPRYREVRSQLREILRALDEQYGGAGSRRCRVSTAGRTRPRVGITQPDNMGLSVINGLRNYVNPYRLLRRCFHTAVCHPRQYLSVVCSHTVDVSLPTDTAWSDTRSFGAGSRSPQCSRCFCVTGERPECRRGSLLVYSSSAW
jgi:hypothetical protein